MIQVRFNSPVTAFSNTGRMAFGNEAAQLTSTEESVSDTFESEKTEESKKFEEKSASEQLKALGGWLNNLGVRIAKVEDLPENNKPVIFNITNMSNVKKKVASLKRQITKIAEDTQKMEIGLNRSLDTEFKKQAQSAQ